LEPERAHLPPPNLSTWKNCSHTNFLKFRRAEARAVGLTVIRHLGLGTPIFSSFWIKRRRLRGVGSGVGIISETLRGYSRNTDNVFPISSPPLISDDVRAGWAKQIQVRLRKSGFGGTNPNNCSDRGKSLSALPDQAEVRAGGGSLGVWVALCTVLPMDSSQVGLTSGGSPGSTATEALIADFNCLFPMTHSGKMGGPK